MLDSQQPGADTRAASENERAEEDKEGSKTAESVSSRKSGAAAQAQHLGSRNGSILVVEDLSSDDESYI